MHGKILIVDTIPTNRIVLKVKLAAAYYDVVQAGTLAEACTIAADGPLDLAICAANLPDGDPADLVKALASRRGGGTPVMVTARNLPDAERLRLLSSGVDELIDEPVQDALLVARVRSLIRAHNTATEWHIRDDTTRALGFAEDATSFAPQSNVVLVGANTLRIQGWAARLRPLVNAELSLRQPQMALADVDPESDGDTTDTPDIFVLVTEDGATEQMLALLSSIRAHSGTRHSAILVLQQGDDPDLGARALDLGANALMQRDFNAHELALRLGTLIRRKRIGDQLRATVRTGLKAAVSDPLTGLHNRRYAMPHLARLAQRAQTEGRPFALMVADMDHFKQINDVYGHAAGDAVLVETARRLRENLRGVDLVARVGGEEFLIVMPGVPIKNARGAAKRLCRLISDTPFDIPGGPPIHATISIGLAVGGTPHLKDVEVPAPEVTAQILMQQADKALYKAKVNGRNCVTLSRPAA